VNILFSNFTLDEGLTIPLDTAIYNHLLAVDGATWGDLRHCVPGKQLSDSSLKKALDRLNNRGLIESHAELKGTKAITVYRAKKSPLQTINDAGGHSLLLWVLMTLRKFENTRGGDLSEDELKFIENIVDKATNQPQNLPEVNHPRPPSLYELRRAIPQEKPGDLVNLLKEEIYRLPDRQGEALAIAIQWLGLQILGEIKQTVRLTSKEERSQHLDAWSRTYFVPLLLEIARLASPEYGDLDSAMSDALNELDPNKVSQRVLSKKRIMKI
jgi:hypothetical protein